MVDVKSLFDINGKVALITGATGAFGAEIAMGLSQAGANIMATGRNEEKLKSLVEEIKKSGGKAAYSTGDPAKYDDVLIVVTWIEKLGRSSITFGYQIECKSNHVLLALGQTTNTFVNQKLKCTRPPKEFYNALLAQMDMPQKLP